MFSSRRMLSTPGLLFLKLFFSHNPRSLFISAASFYEEWRHLDVSFLKYFFYLLLCAIQKNRRLFFLFFFLIFKFDIVSPFEKFKRKVLIFFSPRYFSFDFMFWKKLFFFFFDFLIRYIVSSWKNSKFRYFSSKYTINIQNIR